MEKEKQVQLKYGLEKIITKEFCLKESETKINNDKPIFVVISTNMQINSKEGKIAYLITISLFNNDKKEIEFCKLVLVYLFKVFNLNKLVVEKNKVKLPDNFVRILTNISYATTRGILYEKLSRTFLENSILPPINPDTIMPKPNIEIESQNTKSVKKNN